MRILVHGDSLGGHWRMARAAVGLALRGHVVQWLGGHLPPSPLAPPEGCLMSVAGGAGRTRLLADVVLGGADGVRDTGLAGWMSRAHVMVLDFEGGEPSRWTAVDRLAWSSLFAGGLVPSATAAALAARAELTAGGRLGLWPDEGEAAGPDVAHADTEILERACERTLARHRGRSFRPAVFVDRDGTLVIERGYLSDPAEIELLAGVPEALQNIRAAGHPVVVVSNQSGVARGLFPLARVYQAMAALRVQLRAHGVELDAIYFCPHQPEDGCDCRKPRTGMLERAADDLLLDLAASAVIGDKLLDVETAHNARALGVLVRTGYGRDEEDRASAGNRAVRPDHVAESLLEAADWLLRREGLGS